MKVSMMFFFPATPFPSKREMQAGKYTMAHPPPTFASLRWVKPAGDIARSGITLSVSIVGLVRGVKGGAVNCCDHNGNDGINLFMPAVMRVIDLLPNTLFMKLPAP